MLLATKIPYWTLHALFKTTRQINDSLTEHGNNTDGDKQQVAKKSKIEIRSEEELVQMKKYLLVLSKLELSNALAARTHRAIIIDCYNTLTASSLVAARLQAQAM